jgi:type I restriction enzyme, S subunit
MMSGSVYSWDECTLESVVYVVDPHPSHRAPPEARDGIPFPGIGDFNVNGEINRTSCRKVNIRIYEEHQLRYQIKDGDLGFGRVASIGKVIRLKRDELPFAVSPTLAILKPHSIDPGFLCQYLQGPQLSNQITKLLTGTTRSSLGLQILRKLRIQTPPVPEQKIIAEILSTVDRAIEQTEALIAKQQRIKIGLMQDLLTRGIDKQGKLRSESTHQFKDSSLGRIPIDWEIQTLERCVKSNAPICYGILMPGTGFDNGVPVIKVKDINGGRILQDGLLLTDPKIDNQYKRSRLHFRDLLITIRGTTGRIAIVPIGLDGANITQDTARIRLKDECHVAYFYFLLQSKCVQDQVLLHTVGQAVKGINISEVKRISFPLPSKPEQEVISARMAELEDFISVNSRSHAKFCAIKTAMMQALLTGRKRVTNLIQDHER